MEKSGDDGEPGTPGQPGPTGNGIASTSKTGTSGLVDTYTITYTNGNTDTFTVTNGQNGTNGTNGTNRTRWLYATKRDRLLDCNRYNSDGDLLR